MDERRIIFWDLEFFSMNWGADVGSLICMGWKEAGEKKVHIESIADYHGKTLIDDGPLVERCMNILSGADLWVTYNGIRCDVPFMTTRSLVNKLGPLPPVAHKDLYYTVRHKLKMSSSSLLSLQRATGAKNEKTPVILQKWIQAIAGYKKPLAEIEKHCYQDVLVLEEKYNELLPYMFSHPRLHGYGVCNKCGGTLLKNKVYYTSSKNPKITVKCRSCGGYETRQATKKEIANLGNAI